MESPKVFDSVAHGESRVEIRNSCNCKSTCCIPLWKSRKVKHLVELPKLESEKFEVIKESFSSSS